MTIRTKYEDLCRKCLRIIRKGKLVDWVKGKGIRHLHCAYPEKYPDVEDDLRLPDMVYKPKKSYVKPIYRPK